MREIKLQAVTEAVKKAVIDVNYHLDHSLVGLIQKAKKTEKGSLARSILQDILDNQDIAREGNLPLCQDTGMVVVFVEMGLETWVSGDLDAAINQGVREGYDEGYLRKSVVAHPFKRINTKDNTPAVIHYTLKPGDGFKLKIATKGAGSENMSLVKMLTPAHGVEGVRDLILDTVKQAGGKACPPIILGIGLGGNLEKSAFLAKEALLRELDDVNEDPHLAELEARWLDDVNKLDVGPMGIGGTTTCLAVKINTYPMHIASLPVAINIQCHSARHTEVSL